jgi:DNA-binding beta-propeller fold protein YncE
MPLRVAVAVGVLVIATFTPVESAQAPAVSSGAMIVAVNQRREAATIYDVSSGRVLASVELGIEPHEVAVSPSGRVVAIAGLNEGRLRRNRKLLLLDPVRRQLRHVELGLRGPHGVTFVSDSLLMVSAMFDGSVAYVDVPSGRVMRTVTGLAGEPYVLHLARPIGRAYVSSPESGVVIEIDVAGAKKLRVFPVEDSPAGMNVSPDGAEVWAAVWREGAGGGMAVIDIARGQVVAKVTGLTQPRRVAFAPDGNRVFVTDRDHLRVIDRAKREIVASVFLGTNAGGSGLSCAPDGSRCYIATSTSGEVIEVDVNGFKVLRRFPAERGADGIAFVQLQR